MDKNEQRLIQEMIDEGTIQSYSTAIIDGKCVEWFIVLYEDNEYNITKHDKEIVYIHRVIK